ncbi:asparagine synthase [Microbacterium sp. NIBRBAC000506063]|uniref:asparagine synthase n=1 Tax=Microbacterium sp. NIBRBAC000506063 TaxID=2734618 RepID=UPI001CB756F7|nr:asparagine synthase [Microbacterium sp. NIBRBAC000506063]
MGRTADAIAEGVAIATAAAPDGQEPHPRRHDRPGGVFDLAEHSDGAREALIDLAVESETAAELATRLRKRARGRYSDPSGTHDYRDRDVRNLRRRAKQSAGVAQKLREMADDPAAVQELVHAAREAAWGDVRSNLDRRLQVEGMRADQDPDYATMREARMQALRLVDLQALSAQTRSRRTAAEEE